MLPLPGRHLRVCVLPTAEMLRLEALVGGANLTALWGESALLGKVGCAPNAGMGCEASVQRGMRDAMDVPRSMRAKMQMSSV